MNKTLKSNLLCIISFLFFLSSNPSFGRIKDRPTIVAGKSKITGRITSPPDKNKDSIFVNINVPHQISGEYVKYKALVDQSGKFSIDADVETTISLIGLSVSLNPYQILFVKLKSDGVTNIDITYNSDNEIKNMVVNPHMSPYDMTQGFGVMGKMIEYNSGRAPETLYNKSTDYFLNYAKNIFSERLAILKNDTLLSKELKEVLSKEFCLFMYIGHVFPYDEEMTRNYHNTNADLGRSPDIQKIDRSYFRFLKDFNLNDPQYLNCSTFQEFQKEILRNEILELPIIGDRDIPYWLASVKVILSDLVGFKDGPYYQILAANAYGRQLTEEIKPLTEKQKKNIVNYWKNGEITKILFRKNKEVMELSRLKSPTVVNDISSVSDDKVIETIVSKYKNKAVFIDLWATWCAPCLDAMQQFRSTKDDFRDKDVAFVYLTNKTSPKKLWEEKIKGIGNEHYYLTDSQWAYMMNYFKFEGIPSYLLFNKEGVLINKFTAFPGSDKVKEMINGQLEMSKRSSGE